MNLDVFKTPDPSGRMSKESYLFNNYKEEYDYIVDYCQLNKLFDLSFKEKVYLCLNNINKIPTCHNPNCNKRVKFKNSTLGYLKYCSNKCISSDPNIKKIKEEKSLEKFGTKAPAQSKLIREKIIKTNREKWGGNSPMSSKEVQEKSKCTLKKNWGVDNPAKSNEILEKRITSFKNNIEQYKYSYKMKSIEKYGVEHPWKDKEIHNKSVLSSKEIRLSTTVISISKMLPENYEIIDICPKTIEASIKCNLNHNFKSSRSFIYGRFKNNSEICTICNPLNSQKSGPEILLNKFIKDHYSGEIIENNRNIINPFEVDIYLTELKLAIEYNGLWWHSSEYREYDYHLNKQKIAVYSNIKLLTIWEDDWINKNDIVKSYIINKLGKTVDKIWARKCHIFEVSKNESNIFLNQNHFYGKSNSSIRISLRLNSETVSLMTFKRSGKGWILERFCNKNYTLVVGSFSKILKYFINKYNPDFIISYSDNMMSNGDIYRKFGFLLDSEITPTYTLLVEKQRVHRLSIENSNEYPKIWNAGLKKWIWKNKKLIINL
jgi:hypothetical protein